MPRCACVYAFRGHPHYRSAYACVCAYAAVKIRLEKYSKAKPFLRSYLAI